MVLSSKIEVRASGIAGHGLYAKERIAKGETIWTPDEDEQSRYWFTMDQIKTWPEDEQKHFFNNAYLVAPNTYSGVRFGVESDKGEFMNHSCSPNCIVITDELWVAGRDIEVDEEVCYDYACSETTASTHMPFPCSCGTKECRGKITGEDCLKPEIRAKYEGHFTSLVQEFQKENGDNKAKTAAPAAE